MATKPDLDPVRGAMKNTGNIFQKGFGERESAKDEYARKQRDQVAANAKTRGKPYAQQQADMRAKVEAERQATMARSGRK